MVARQRGARPCTTVARLALVTLVALAACPLAPRPPAARAEAPGFDARRFFGHEGIVSLAVGDLDGDGDLDAVGGGSATFAFGLVYLNDGAGVLTAGPSRELLPPPGTIGSGEASHVALGDMDGDGDLDIVTAGTGAFSPTVAERNLIYFNGGVGQFPPEDARGFSQDAAEVSALALGDLDGDGDLDIVEARLGGQNRVYLNDGAGGFDTSLLLGGPDTPTADVEVGDLDGDGALDILEVNRFGQSRVYLGDGAGGFDEAGALPVGAPAGGLARAALGDVDGDGDLDIVADLQPGADAARPTGAIFLNDGAGGFPEDPSLPFGGPRRDAAALALGDLDGDGLLDIVAGNFANPGAVYLGQRSGGALGYSEQPLRTTSTFAVALGELNGDGALDIVVGDYFQSAVHLSSGFGRLRPEPVLDTPLGFFAFGRVRAGDLDGDGALDFVVSELAVAPPDPQPGPRLLVYRGDGAGGFPPDRRAELSTGGAGVGDFALGDVDGDGDLDLVAATRGAGLLVLRNDGAGGFPGPPQRFGPEALDARRLALGDLNNDGALDAVVAYLPLAGDSTDPRETGFDRIFFGDGRGGFDGGRPLDEDGRDTSSLALGDLDGDGDSDLVVQDAREATVYLNDGAGGMAAAGAIGPLGAQGPELALGDLDGDGDLDVVSADFNQSWIARNDGAGGFGPPAIFTKGSYARPLLGDLDGDGDLDIVADAVYRNGGAGEVAARLSLEPADPADLGGQPLGGLDAVALGDFDGDGAPDVLAASFNDPVQIFLYRNRLARPAGLPNNPPAVRIAQPAPPPATLGEASQVVSLTYTLADPEGDPVREVRAFFSLDGGGSWRPAAAAPGAATTGLAAAPGGSEHVFPWDLFASGVFGQADRVAFRIEAYQAGGGFDAAAPSWQRPYSATQTAPFRVRGTQVRVLGEDGAPRQGAVVYRLPAGAGTGALPLGPAGGAAFSSDGEGFLQGRGALAPGDRLVALAPVAAADSYGLYLTSAAPTAEGLAATEVLTPGVQTLRLAAAHPLVLFTLEVSLEWDARGDAQQLARLEADLRRASAALYDWTDGQAALGEVVVYHDRERWNEAHIRVYGTNRLRPNANQGGIVGAPISETLVLDGAERTITYEPGQVRMGAVWNRYGEPGAIGDDWPRTLAHELGHFALFLDDNYLGLDAAGRLVQVSTCAGAMADPYVDDVSELRPRAGWLPGCALTLSNRLTGRADWETFAAFYERPALGFALRPPGAFNANPGPAALPLAVTQLRFVEPAAPPPDLGAATVYLVDEGGGALQPDAGALALLFQAGRGRLLDLGGVVLDRAEVRGARQGDRLCVFEAARGRLGCERLRAGDQQLTMREAQGWRPDLAITPVTTSTVAVAVEGVEPGLRLWAQLYPVDGPAAPPVALAEGAGRYSGAFALAEPALSGHVHIWVDEPEDGRRELVSGYAVGGNPGSERNRTGARNNPGSERNRTAPVLSGDGQAILFTSGEELAAGEIYTLQSLAPRDPPAWATPVGQAYRLTTTADAARLRDGASLSIGYLTQEVPPGAEQGIVVFYRAGAGEPWRELATALDTARNEAVALAQGPGQYALMTRLRLRPGWNLVAYPWPEAPTVAESLARLNARGYTTVYGYSDDDPADPWAVYDIGAPAWVNDLETLRYGQGYWLRLEAAGAAAHVASPAEALPAPPATYYGHVEELAGPAPAGARVTALVGGVVCAETTTFASAASGGRAVFVIDVPADDGGARAGCGVPGRAVSFELDGRRLPVSATWANGRPQALRPLAALETRLFLPALWR